MTDCSGSAGGIENGPSVASATSAWQWFNSGEINAFALYGDCTIRAARQDPKSPAVCYSGTWTTLTSTGFTTSAFWPAEVTNIDVPGGSIQSGATSLTAWASDANQTGHQYTFQLVPEKMSILSQCP